MENKQDNNLKHWYAARIIVEKELVWRFFDNEGVKTYSTTLVPSVAFLYVDKAFINKIYDIIPGKMFFYKNPTRTEPEFIPDKEMENFIMVTSTGVELINLGEPKGDFLKGQRVRVKEGPFKGAVGVVKRIKGDRRLVIAIDGVTAVATNFIRNEFLEPVEEE